MQRHAADPTRLLLVDDDPDLQFLFRRMLEQRGYSVDTASDGVAGWDAALAKPYDAIVLDLDMPRLDGWGLLARLKGDARTCHVPVAVLSCQDEYREALRAQDSGAAAYVSKGTRPSLAAQQIHLMLEPARQLVRALATRERVDVGRDLFGTAWIVRTLRAAKVSGTLAGRDGWASYLVAFEEGEAVHALAWTATHRAEGDRAFTALIASRAFSGQFEQGSVDSPRTLDASTGALLRQAADILNLSAVGDLDERLVACGAPKVNDALYALFSAVGPSDVRGTARMMCVEGLSPREVLARSGQSPMEVEEHIRELARRGVIELAA